ARAAVSPPKFPPSTSTFLRPITATSLTSAGSPTRHVQDTYGGIGVARVAGPAMQVQGLAFLLAAFARLAATLVLIGNKAPRLPRIQSRAADGPKPALSAALKMRRRTFDAFDASLILGRTSRRRDREVVTNRAPAGTLAVGPTPCVTLNRTRARSAAAY